MMLAFVTSQFDILRQTKTLCHFVNNRSLSGKFGREMKRNVKKIRKFNLNKPFGGWFNFFFGPAVELDIRQR